MSGPVEEDGDYAREFFGAHEREADRIANVCSCRQADGVLFVSPRCPVHGRASCDW